MKGVSSQRTAASSGTANRTECSPWKKNKKNTQHTRQRLWPVYENHTGISLITLLHKHTQNWERRGVVCVRECVRVHTQAYVTVCMIWSAPIFFSQTSERFGSESSTFWHFLLYFDILKSSGSLQGTIKLSNGHNHYVKVGIYCQLFEHCWLPGSEDKMSGAQYFRPIKLSAFLFSLITF